MYRRRRTDRNKISFSFDSFLDVVTNVIGIIIRLIIVSWVGARAYTTAMLTKQEAAQGDEIVVMAPLEKPRAQDDPVSKILTQEKRELNKLRSQLSKQLKDLDLVQAKESATRRNLTLVDSQRKDVHKRKQAVDQEARSTGQGLQVTALSVEQIRQKEKKLLEEIQAVAKLPAPTKTLRYHTPVSRPVKRDEIFFECRGGRVAFIDVDAMLQDMEHNIKAELKAHENQWKFEAVTSQVGPYRLRYFIQRAKSFADEYADGGTPRRGAPPVLAGWIVEPMTENRGEPVDVALASSSAFRQIIDGVVPDQSVVTLWVYADSFAAFRQLRDFLHQQGIEVAGWPLRPGGAIAASRYGSASRGQ